MNLGYIWGIKSKKPVSQLLVKLMIRVWWVKEHLIYLRVLRINLS